MSNNQILSRQSFIAELLRREPALGNSGIHALPNCAISLETHNTYCIANSDRILEQVARVLVKLRQQCGATDKVLIDLVHNLTAENTAVGYLAQFQGYDWLLGQGVSFTPEVMNANTLRGAVIALDGRIEASPLPIYFDIKSIGFEPELRAVLRKRLEDALPGHIVTISGGGDHGVDAIRTEAFVRLKDLVKTLETGTQASIPALGWTIHKARHTKPNVYMSEISYNSGQFANENRAAPLAFASQFTTNAPYILMFVLPDGVGSSPLKANLFKLAESLLEGISGYVFGIARTDQSAASIFDGSLPNSVRVAHAAEMLSGVALFSPQADLALLHLNGAARYPLTEKHAEAVAKGWEIRLLP